MDITLLPKDELTYPEFMIQFYIAISLVVTLLFNIKLKNKKEFSNYIPISNYDQNHFTTIIFIY